MIEELSYSLHIGNDKKTKTSKAKQIAKERPINFNNNASQNCIQLSKVESWKQRVNEIVDFISERVKGFFDNMIKSKYKDVVDDLMENNILTENEYKRICDITIKKENKEDKKKDYFEL